MKNSYLVLFLLILLISGCKDDENLTSPYFDVGLLGKWERTDGNNYYQNVKYLVINSDNFYYFLTDEGNGVHFMYDDLYSVKGDLIDMNGRGLYKFKIIGDTLKLTNSYYNLIFLRTPSAPDETEWITQLTVEKEIQLADTIRVSDITFDGSCFWISNGYNNITKIDTTGNALLSFPEQFIYGITYNNGSLWISKSDSLKKVDPLNGQTTLFWQGFYLDQLAYAENFIWGRRSSYYFKIKEESGELVDTIFFPNIEYLSPLQGIEIKNGKLWIISGGKLFSINPESGFVIENYELPENYNTLALTFAGNNLWVVAFKQDSYILLKIKMPESY